MPSWKLWLRGKLLSIDRYARYTLPYHLYLVHPSELALLCGFIDETRGLSGPIVEIGCELGRTTIFLNKHMDVRSDNRKYICLDTFAGFTEGDIFHEVSIRSQSETFLKSGFRNHRKEFFERAMEINEIHRVEAIQADIKDFRFEGIENISFCFVDVDLYLPVLSALNKVHSLMAPKGIIAVHDCDPSTANPYSGAFSAYAEFVESKGLPQNILERCGIVRI